MPVVRAYKRLSKPRARYNETRAQADVRLASEQHYQTQSCRALAKLHGPGLRIVWYQDVCSTLQSERPERERMFAECNPGDILVADALSRYQRNQYDALEFWNICKARKVTFYVRQGGLTNDKGSPISKLVYDILSAVDEYQREEFRERMAEVQATAVANGKTIGCPRKMTPELAERARELMAEGNSMRAVAKMLKLKIGTLSGSLKNYYPVGASSANGVEHSNGTVVPEEEYAF